jgi:hypothetical protein
MASGSRCWTQLPHIVWTSEDAWDPASLDSVIFNDSNWYKAEPSPPLPNPMYDEYGECCGHVLINHRAVLPSSRLVVFWCHWEGDVWAYYSTCMHGYEY